MTKKKKNYFKNLIYIRSGITNFYVINRLLMKSLLKNTELPPLNRICFRSEQFYNYNIKTYSRPKLKCMLTTSKRVPSRQFNVSRYYLVRYADDLNMGAFIKK